MTISLQLIHPNWKPVHAPVFTVPRSVEQEIVRFEDIGVLEEDYYSEYSPFSPIFAITKKKGTIRIVTDFRKLNLLLKCHPFPIPKIGDIIHSMEGFTFSTESDLTWAIITSN
jgi:hypothetical protein